MTLGEMGHWKSPFFRIFPLNGGNQMLLASSGHLSTFKGGKQEWNLFGEEKGRKTQQLARFRIPRYFTSFQEGPFRQDTAACTQKTELKLH